MARTTISLEDSIEKKIAWLANSENRSVPNYIETVLLNHLEEIQFADDYEQAAFDKDILLAKEYQKGCVGLQKK